METISLIIPSGIWKCNFPISNTFQLSPEHDKIICGNIYVKCFSENQENIIKSLTRMENMLLVGTKVQEKVSIQQRQIKKKQQEFE